jgi:hypothetical protein
MSAKKKIKIQTDSEATQKMIRLPMLSMIIGKIRNMILTRRLKIGLMTRNRIWQKNSS